MTVDSRLLGAALLAAVAALMVLVVTRPPARTPILVTAAPVAAGTRVGVAEFHERSVLDPSGLVAASRLGELGEALLAIDLAAGVPLVEAAIALDGASSPDVIGLELDAAAAVHGALVPGDRVDIYPAVSDGSVLASDVTVAGVVVEDQALSTGDVGLLLAVEGDLAALIVDAIHGDGVHLVRRGH
jgi:hypothetical protein